MNKKQYLALFLVHFGGYIVGAVLPLLPVYAARLGAPPAVTGYYLAFVYLALTAGTLAGGWLSDRFGRRRALLALAGVLGIPATWAIGRVNQVWALTLATAVTWFVGGVGLALTSILAGLFAGSGERGKVYGFLSLAAGAGGLVGGLIVGPLADRWGYPTMFALVALFLLLWPAAALVIRDPRADRVLASERAVNGGRLRLGKSFYALLAVNLVAAVSVFVGILGRSLGMNALGFAAAAISSTGAISSGVSLPLRPLIGRLSDRLGRKQFLILAYLVSAASLVALSLSTSLWHFWLAVVLQALSGAVAQSVGPALANDLLPSECLGRGLGLYNASNWIGAVVGFVGTGYAVQGLGLTSTLVWSAVLPLISILLLVPVRKASAPAEHPSARLEGDRAG
jgi:MFS family permease